MKLISSLFVWLSFGTFLLFTTPCLSESRKDQNTVNNAGPEQSALQVEGGKLGIVGVHFDSGSSKINDKFIAQLNQIAKAIKSEKLNQAKILIKGHSDSKGSAEDNLVLSKLRAKNAMELLVEQFGIDRNRLAYSGVGETTPIAPNDTESGRSLNRRIEFIYLGDIKKH